MGQDFWQVIGFILVGIVPWLGGYIIQKGGGHRSVILHPPRWVVWLCGNPRGDGQLDLGDGGMQLTSLIPLVGGPLSVILGIEFHWRLAMVISTYLFAVVVWLIILGWANWQERRRRTRQ